MRKAAVVYFGGETSLVKSLSEALFEGIKSQGIDCDLINGRENRSSMAGFRYIALGVHPSGLFSAQIEETVENFLKQSVFNPMTRFFIFIPQKGVGMNKKIVEFMSLVESYGLFIKNSGIIKDDSEAFNTGKELHIIDHL